MFVSWLAVGMAKRSSPEHNEQAALIKWADLQSDKRYGLLYAIPNGGHRVVAVAARLKSEGVRAGVPDLFWPVASSGFHGLYIEMKYGKNKLTTSQRSWRDALIEQGYAHVVCYDWTAASEEMKKYLNEGRAMT